MGDDNNRQDEYIQLAKDELSLKKAELDFKIRVAEDIKTFLYKVLEEAQRD